MGHSPEIKPTKAQVQSKWTMQRNLFHLDYFREFSPLLTSTSWWSLQKKRPHHRTYNHKQ